MLFFIMNPFGLSKWLIRQCVLILLLFRNRNELAETLELLKAQIDPALLKTNSSQQENSSRESPSIEDEDTKKGEEASTQGFLPSFYKF